jgi:enoyl-CoA hydratase/carnithine racemase
VSGQEAAAGPALTVEQRPEGVALVTLNLPDRRNAMTAELTRAWAATMDGLRTEPGLRCLAVTGAGSAFCAGGDLGWIAESPDLGIGDVRERMLAFYRDWLSIREIPVPTIAAINGPAIGAGLCLALACDLRYAARRAVFAAPFTALGMHPGMAATWLLPEAVGVSRARELLFTGRRVGAEEAARLGLVHAVVDDDRLLEAALEIAGTIAATGPLATRLTKEALAQGGHRSAADSLAWEGLAQPTTLISEDLREGLAAQRERRAPRFTGR